MSPRTSPHVAQAEQLGEVIMRAAAEVKAAEDRLVDAVAAARTAGMSWSQIGEVFGVSRQAIWQRFAARVEDRG